MITKKIKKDYKVYNSEYTVNNTNEFIEMKTIAEGQSLANLILRDRIYVDKTKYIFSLLRSHERVFISRPRRFGKSLTLVSHMEN